MSATTDIGDTLAFIARIAAARRDATPTQLDDMQRLLVPQLIAMRATRNTTGAKTILAEIMGPDWQPSGDLNLTGDSAITVLTEGMRARGHNPADLLGPPR